MTGGVFSPFSFLYLTVIVVAAAMLPAGGVVFAGLSAIAYGLQAVLMYYQVLPLPTTIEGIPVTPSASRVLSQILIHIVGFVLVALLVSYLTILVATGPLRCSRRKPSARDSSSR